MQANLIHAVQQGDPVARPAQPVAVVVDGSAAPFVFADAMQAATLPENAALPAQAPPLADTSCITAMEAIPQGSRFAEAAQSAPVQSVRTKTAEPFTGKGTTPAGNSELSTPAGEAGPERRQAAPAISLPTSGALPAALTVGKAETPEAGVSASISADDSGAEEGARDVLAEAQPDPRSTLSPIPHGRAVRGTLHKAAASAATAPTRGSQTATGSCAVTNAATDPAVLTFAMCDMVPGATPAQTPTTDARTPPGPENKASVAGATANAASKILLSSAADVQAGGVVARPSSPATSQENRKSAGASPAGGPRATDDQETDLALLPKTSMAHHAAGHSAPLPTFPEAAAFSQTMTASTASIAGSGLTHASVRLAIEGSEAGGMAVTQTGAKSAHRLEIAVEDPTLGVVNIRAELRGGELHASLTGVAESMVNAAPALQQFLQEHSVSVHEIRMSGKFESASGQVPAPAQDGGQGMTFGSGNRESNPQGQPPGEGSRAADRRPAREFRAAPKFQSPASYLSPGISRDPSRTASLSIHI